MNKLKFRLKNFYNRHRDRIISLIGITVGVTMLLAGLVMMGIPVRTILVSALVIVGAVVALIGAAIF